MNHATSGRWRTLAAWFGAVSVLCTLPNNAEAQINTGSTGKDGAFNPTTSTVVDMGDHPDGIYHYTSVNIPTSVTVTFVPNSNNTPVVWLVQGNCSISGNLYLYSSPATSTVGGQGGPGGYRGGAGGTTPTPGQGPGGGSAGASGGWASYATFGLTNNGVLPGPTYGNTFVIPLVGGSGGGGATNGYGGSGGGGAILIAASGVITITGYIYAFAASGYQSGGSGFGSGGAVRLAASRIAGGGQINVATGSGLGGQGRVRFDTLENDFGGSIFGSFSQGYQPIILPTANQGTQLTVVSVAGVPVSASPTGLLTVPDAIISPQQINPISVIVKCSNLSLHTLITVSIKPTNGLSVSATGFNDAGTLASSTANILINIPRGGGLIYATAATSN